jgi:hypothetical protein
VNAVTSLGGGGQRIGFTFPKFLRNLVF